MPNNNPDTMRRGLGTAERRRILNTNPEEEMNIGGERKRL